ncbi:hypothetical protein HJC23_002998 [Cyclotella cryptica]|uniref:DUF202 domain-containing protein n=1 Tax=Cyclotella cryptica TaxID=29204 RepID=A0ABD3PTR9_9STRA|eukprot:CCRYP_011792-RB/>CCRYP_011792-RB protein AED:0.06 eAED:0.06 QI:286/1/1/1/0.5/0.4/5/2547/226
MATERTPLVAPSPSGGDQPTVYFLERRDSKLASSVVESSVIQSNLADAEEIETLPEGSLASNFDPRPVTSAGVARANSLKKGEAGAKSGWFNFFGNVGKKVNMGETGSMALPRSVPVKVDPKVFFANERTFLAWLHVSVILAGASVAIVAFSDSHSASADQLYGVILLPVSIAFIIYAMMQYARRASMIRRKAPGPYVDIAGPTVLTVILMLSIVAQFSIKLYTLM